MDGDARSFRVALTADAYVNPPPGGVDGLAVLDQAGWGVMQLPDAAYPAEMTRRILADVAEQVQEFRRHGYDIVLIGEQADLAAALADAGLPVPDQVLPAGARNSASSSAPGQLRGCCAPAPLQAAGNEV